MKTTLYYFTGTGNSLKIARDLSANIPNSRVEPIAKYYRRSSVRDNSEAVGFIFPLYFFGMPAIVVDFVKKIELRASIYTFAVITRGGTPGCALHQLRILRKEESGTLNAGFYVRMGTNFIPRYRIRSQKRMKKYFERAGAKVIKIAQIVNSKKNNRANDMLLIRSILLLLYNRWVRSVHYEDRNFWVDKRCNACRICEKVCPVDNIQLKDGRPVWSSQCQQCLACLHFCPVSAIQWGKGTIRKNRYHHPDICVDNIIDQKRS